MTIYPAIYWAEYFDPDNMTMVKVSGCTFAESFTKATKKIEDYYGEELCTLKLELIEECGIIEFKDYEEADRIVKD